MYDIAKGMVVVMIDKRIGKRIKQCRERLGLTQEEFAEKTGFTANYISTLERGASFPRCENLILLLNALEVSADAIFCDVLTHTTKYKANQLSQELDELPEDAQKRILQMVELMIQQEKQNTNWENWLNCADFAQFFLFAFEFDRLLHIFMLYYVLAI